MFDGNGPYWDWMGMYSPFHAWQGTDRDVDWSINSASRDDVPMPIKDVYTPIPDVIMAPLAQRR